MVCLAAAGAWSAETHAAQSSSGAVSTAIQEFVSGRHSREDAIQLLRNAIAKDPKSERAIEAEYYIANLWLGEMCREQAQIPVYIGEVERIRHEYPEGSKARQTYWYLELQITYAQAIADKKPKLARKLMWEVAKFDPSQIEVPEKGPWWNSKAAAIARLKTGAVWAVLSDSTRKLYTIADQKKREGAVEEVANQVIRDMQADEELRRCIPYAQWWVRVEKAKKGERVPPPQDIPFEELGPKREKASEVWKREGRTLITPVLEKDRAKPLPPTRPAQPEVVYKELGPVRCERKALNVTNIVGGALLLIGVLLIGVGLFRRRGPRDER